MMVHQTTSHQSILRKKALPFCTLSSLPPERKAPKTPLPGRVLCIPRFAFIVFPFLLFLALLANKPSSFPPPHRLFIIQRRRLPTAPASNKSLSFSLEPPSRKCVFYLQSDLISIPPPSAPLSYYRYSPPTATTVPVVYGFCSRQQ